MNQESIFLTQRMMAVISQQDPSVINKYIMSRGIQFIETGNQRNLKYSVDSVREILSHFISNAIRPKKRVLGFYNFKGGTGKTTMCFQVSTHLALCGYKVLVIDSDPQGNLSSSLGFDTTDNYFTLYDIIINKVAPKEVIKNIFPGFDCIPSNISCSRFDMELIMRNRREEQFKMLLAPLKEEYDFIIFDTNPYISFVVRNVTVFADIMVVPCETQPYSVNALRVLFEDLESFFASMQADMPQYVVVPNKYEDRYGTSLEAMSILKHTYEKYLIPDFAVRKAEDFNISAREGLPLSAIAKKNSIALHDTIDLMHYLLNQASQ